MLDIKRIRKETEYIQELLNRKGKYSLSEVLELDETRREFLTRVEQMKARQNKVSKQIPALKKEGKDTKEIFIEMKQLSDSIKEIDTQLKDIENRIEVKLLNIPNIPSEDVPIGEDEDDNEVIESWGDIPRFGFEPQAHWDLGVNLDILDFERAVKLSGARFSMYKGMGAKLHRALSAFMLDIASKNGYREIVPPLIVTRDTMQGTGQLPKFEDDAFSIDGKDMFLIPTAEVPLANIYANEIVSEDLLPINFTAYTSCFRREAGSAGRDTRGIIRNHQFEKVELVKVVKPENSYLELERLLSNAREVLELLGLPYRVIKLCTGDLSFSASMTYDLEVYMPSYSRYLEISSCSNCVDYQARRMNLRFRDSDNKVKVAHTLNGSALAIGRTVAAIIENYQNEDGSITIPKVLVKYMSGVNKIESKK